jgi:VanZ family protein
MNRENLRLPAVVVLVGYWLALVAGTHMPHPPRVIHEFDGVDKLLHAMAYMGLAFMTAGTIRLWRRLSLGQLLGIAVLLALFAVADEWTQPLFSRDCDVFDWLADLAGIASGLTLLTGLAALLRRVPEGPPVKRPATGKT